MGLAAEVANLSSDPIWQNGAVVARPQKQQWRAYWNCCIDPGMESVDALRLMPTLAQVTYLEMAERAVLARCARFGDSTHGATMYALWGTDEDSARMIILAGISRVVFWHKAIESSDVMRPVALAGMRMLKAAGVQVDLYHGPIQCSAPSLRFWCGELELAPGLPTNDAYLRVLMAPQPDQQSGHQQSRQQPEQQTGQQQADQQSPASPYSAFGVSLN